MKNKEEQKVQAIIEKAVKEGFKDKLMEMIKDVRLYKEGDRVKFNYQKFLDARDFSSFSQQYVDFVTDSHEKGMVYTVVFDPNYTDDPVLLVTFKEDERPVETRWLNYVAYLEPAEGENESN